MAEEVKGFAEHLSGFKRHWKLAALVFGVIICGGGIFTLSLDNVYRSTGFILIEEPRFRKKLSDLRLPLTRVARLPSSMSAF